MRFLIYQQIAVQLIKHDNSFHYQKSNNVNNFTKIETILQLHYAKPV